MYILHFKAKRNTYMPTFKQDFALRHSVPEGAHFFLDPGTGPQTPPTLFLLLFLLALVLVLFLSDLRSAKAFSLHNRSSPNFA